VCVCVVCVCVWGVCVCVGCVCVCVWCVCVCVCVYCQAHVEPLGGAHSRSENFFYQKSENNIKKPGAREIILSIDLQKLITDQLTVQTSDRVVLQLDS